MLLVIEVVLVGGGGIVAAVEGGRVTGVIAVTEGLLVFLGYVVARCPGSLQKKQ